ncbi:hypothetical protein AB0I81_22640 [Nonomuraea sp. NPDC050404]|uniref:hypothetical protein n=1 Tax=Nonomuraea sp. NPDC050404 TaxID=3155783 RepID=UPI0033D9FDCE
MGTSTDAILAYGYDLGEWDKIREAGEFGELALPWLDDDSDDGYREQAERHLLNASGFTEEWTPKSGYFEREEAAKAALGVQFETYCSDSAPMEILAAKVVTVARGYCEVLDLPALMTEPAEHGWDDKLRWACEALGITPTQERPGWVLVSYWG